MPSSSDGLSELPSEFTLKIRATVVRNPIHVARETSMTIDSDAFEPASTTIVHRPFGRVDHYRCVADRASRVCVHAFPLSMAPQLASSGLLSSAGAYILTDHKTAYFGESVRTSRRLAEHSMDDAKHFAKDVFVVSGREGSAFDKVIVTDLQYRLTNLAVGAGVVHVMKGMNPPEPELDAADRSTHDRIARDAMRLLFDAGCRFLRPPDDVPAVVRRDQVVAADLQADQSDSGPVSIGVSTSPPDAQEFELRYDDIWARGFWHDDHFIVAAGSEIRTQTNASCDVVTRGRREDLFQAGVLEGIAGLEDRRRLVAAVAFPSLSIAAKVVCGAHSAGRWASLSRPRVIVLAGLRQGT